jgi:hypothetical protein
MHPMMIEETIRAREEEISKVAENNRLVALALGEQPKRGTRIRNALAALFARSGLKIRNWSRMQPQREAGAK